MAYTSSSFSSSFSSSLSIHELYKKSKSLLDDYFKVHIKEQQDLYANAVKLIAKLAKEGAKADRVRTDLTEMNKVLKYEIISSQVLCRYFELIVTCLGKILQFKEFIKRKSMKSKKTKGGAKQKFFTGMKQGPPKPNQTAIKHQNRWLKNQTKKLAQGLRLSPHAPIVPGPRPPFNPAAYMENMIPHYGADTLPHRKGGPVKMSLSAVRHLPLYKRF